jgi:Trypsin-like peptidase domain/AAA domain
MAAPESALPVGTLNLNSVVCILKNDQGTPVGAGFFCSNNLVLTCAHVVQGLVDEALQGTVYLRTHTTHNSQILEATVESAYWRDSDKEDVAVLRLITPIPDRKFLHLGTSVNIERHKFQTYGFPKNHDLGLHGQGEILGIVRRASGYELLQLTSEESTVGYSGAPVFDQQTRRVVGMISEKVLPDLKEIGKEKSPVVMAHQNTSLATPSSVLLKICQELSAEDICPYRSLNAFTEEDTEFFYGRDNLVKELIRKLESSPQFLAITGASGSGKSSAVQAKVLPQLRRGNVRNFPQHTQILSMRFNAAKSPEQSLLEALNQLDDFLPPSTSHTGEVIQAYIHQNNGRLVIFIDQFEELFTAYSEDIFRVFLQNLCKSLDAHQQLTVILTIRTEFEPLLEASALGARFKEGYWKVWGITSEDSDLDIEQVIVAPAREVGLDVDPGLAGLIIRDLGNTQHPLPLLEFALTELWQRDVSKNRLTCETYEELGKVTGALKNRANELYEYNQQLAANNQWERRKQRGDEQRELMRRILSRLVHFGASDAPDTRCKVLMGDLEKMGSAVPSLLEEMAGARLVVKDKGTVELIHDALIPEWLKQLEGGKWFEQQRQFRIWQQQFDEDLKHWQPKQPKQKYLLSGAPLSVAEGYLKSSHKADLTESQLTCIKTSQWRRTAWRIALSAATITALITFFILWLNAEIQRQTAKSVQLATASEANLETDTTRSVFLALVAMQTKATPAAERALWMAFQANHERLYLENDSTITYGEYNLRNPDRILTISANRARVWDKKKQMDVTA